MPDLRGLVTDPRFQALPVERRRAMLERIQAPEEIIDRFAPAEAPSKMEQLSTGFREGAIETGLDLVNPVSIAKGIYGAGRALADLATPPTVSDRGVKRVQQAVDVAKALGETAKGEHGEEARGRLIGSGVAATVPMMAPGTRVATAAKVPEATGALRFRNITNVLRPMKGQIPELRRLESLGELDVPVAMTRKGMRDKLALRGVEQGKELDAAKAALEGEEISGANAVAKLEGKKPTASYTETVPESRGYVESETILDPDGKPALVERVVPEHDVTHATSGDPDFVTALETRQKVIKELMNEEGNIPAPAAQELKEQFQSGAARRKGYDVPATDEAAASIEGRKAAAAALNDELTGITTPGAGGVEKGERLANANLKVHATKTMEDPLTAYLDTELTKPPAARIAALAGRAAAPAMVGGGAGYMVSPAGALAGITIGALQQSPLWQTFSAAAKARLLKAWAAGDVANFERAIGTEIVMANKARRALEEEQRRQGEGVIGP
jgi:hypothetical protein